MIINKSKILIFSLLFLCFSCAKINNNNIWQTSSQIGLKNFRIENLMSSINDYDVWFSSTIYNPSALLFIPKNTEIKFALETRGSDGWKQIKDQNKVQDLIAIIKERDRLVWFRALVVQNDNISGGAVFLYSRDMANVKKIDDNTYFINDVPNIYNPMYDDTFYFGLRR